MQLVNRGKCTETEKKLWSMTKKVIRNFADGNLKICPEKVKLGNFPQSLKLFKKIGGKSETGEKCIIASGRMDASGITLRSAEGVSFQSAGPTTAKTRFWDREVQDQGTRRSQRLADERSEHIVV